MTRVQNSVRTTPVQMRQSRLILKLLRYTQMASIMTQATVRTLKQTSLAFIAFSDVLLSLLCSLSLRFSFSASLMVLSICENLLSQVFLPSTKKNRTVKMAIAGSKYCQLDSLWNSLWILSRKLAYYFIVIYENDNTYALEVIISLCRIQDTSKIAVQLLKMVLICVEEVDQLAVLGLGEEVRVVVHELYPYALALALLAVDLAFDHFQLLGTDYDLAVVHEELLVAASRTREETTEWLQVFLANLDAGFLFNLCSCNSYKISAFIDHASRCFQQGRLYCHSILLNEEYLIIDKHENGNRMSPQENVTRQLVTILLSHCPHVDKADLVSEHLNAQDLYFADIDASLQMVELISVIPELLAGLHLGQDGLVDVRQREDWNFADLECQLERLNHDM